MAVAQFNELANAHTLRNLYYTRTVVQLIWAAAVLATSMSNPPVAAGLLVLYPLWDVACTVYDLRAFAPSASNPAKTRYTNIDMGTLAAIAIGATVFTFPERAVLAFGVWALAAGLAQFAVGLSRRKALGGGQWAMILSGIQSAAAGVAFILGGLHETKHIKDLGGYAVFGGVYFLIAGILLHRKRSRLSGASPAIAQLFPLIHFNPEHQRSSMRFFLRSIALFAAAAVSTSAAFSQTFPPGVTPVGGAVVSVSATEVNLQTQQGPVTVHLVQPAAVYAGQPSDMSHITKNSYIGVGSVKGSDGKEHATDIKIFPEVFRGLAEGSYMQPGQSGAPSNSRMTNGSVAAPSKPKSGSRMTNGAVTSTGSQLTVGGQQIDVPAGTPVILIAKTSQMLQPGQHVLIPSKKQADGSFSAQNVFLLPAK